MAKAKRRKPAPKKAPMITVQDVEKAPVKDSQGEDILYEVNKRVRTDGTESIPKRKPVTRLQSAEEIRADFAGQEAKELGARQLAKSRNEDFTKDVTPAERNKRNAFIEEGINEAKAREASGIKSAISRAQRKKTEAAIKTETTRQFGKTPTSIDVKRAVKGGHITSDEGKALLRPDKLSQEDIDRVTNESKLTRKETAGVIRNARTTTRTTSNVSKRGMRLIDTATVPLSGTAPGGAPARPVGNDAGGKPVNVGPGMGAPLAVDPKTGKAPTRRVMRPKADILRDRRRRKEKTPRLGTSNFDPNSSLVMGNRPDEDLVRQRDRGRRTSKKGVNTGTIISAEQKRTYRSSLEPSRLTEQLARASTNLGGKPSFTELSKHFADNYVGGHVSELGPVDAPVSLPGGMTDKAVAARQLYFAKVAQTNAIEARSKAMRREQSGKALAAGKQLDPTLDPKKAGEREKLKALGAHSVTGGLYAADSDVREAIRKRDYALRQATKKAKKAGRELSEDEIMDLPGVSREEAVGLTPHEDATKALGEKGNLPYYMGSTEKRGLTYNKGLKDTKIAEIAHHTRMPVSHVRNFINDHGIDVHTLHKDLSEQVYSPGHAKKAFRPTSDPIQTTEMVRFHPSGRVRTRRGRDAAGRNLPARWESIPTSPAKEGIPDSAIMSWVNKLGSLIHTNQATRNLKGPNPYLAEEARHFGAHKKSVSKSVAAGTAFTVGSDGAVSSPIAREERLTSGRTDRKSTRLNSSHSSVSRMPSSA